MTDTITGGCFCGAIRYEINNDATACGNCHCTMCRRTSGAPFVTWLVVPTGAFRFTTGNARELKSSAAGVRTFCADCGTPLTCISGHHADRVDITVGSLDDPGAFPPAVQVYHDTRLPWVQDPVPEYDVRD